VFKYRRVRRASISRSRCPASTIVEIVNMSAPDFLIEISPIALIADRC